MMILMELFARRWRRLQPAGNSAPDDDTAFAERHALLFNVFEKFSSVVLALAL